MTKEIIRQMRLKRKLTQEQLAEKMNTTQRAISRIEREEVHTKKVQEVAKVLGFNLKLVFEDA